MKIHAHMLYVEDEPDDVFFMRDAFRRLGMEVGFGAVEDGGRAISYLAGEGPFADRERHPLPVCVLLDVNLPVRSGFEVLAWVRAQPAMEKLPVIMFSSSGRLEDRQRAQQLGATDYLLKPASGREFIHVARRIAETWLFSPEGSTLGRQ
jgi:CheY-like chemotaxis protein